MHFRTISMIFVAVISSAACALPLEDVHSGPGVVQSTQGEHLAVLYPRTGHIRAHRPSRRPIVGLLYVLEDYDEVEPGSVIDEANSQFTNDLVSGSVNVVLNYVLTHHGGYEIQLDPHNQYPHPVAGLIANGVTAWLFNVPRIQGVNCLIRIWFNLDVRGQYTIGFYRNEHSLDQNTPLFQPMRLHSSDLALLDHIYDHLTGQLDVQSEFGSRPGSPNHPSQQ
ncbi:hypothetical protein C8R42DRAFT_715883 [Lentinula raphanica]|nr:hypothetical protein C8R42DRAFT_715883 [Lentinula raphanica]